MRAPLGFDQPAGNAHAVGGVAHTAFEHIAYGKFAPDLLYVDGLALVSEARIAGDDDTRDWLPIERGAQ